ncbi:PorT family protein [Algibacter amylolyticus]|uniref:PorT family protein n=1 Tax=Algibacter amylolyticus TaxID=1608400 RepID=A0A5M7BKW0_9FLAO|nr:porin family protein [Algibacter amylolyticus]KAA5827891.1 PorT family protein [Algibacter amylolyticus]MBB5267122.1 hypothetical protein [Algibacter amylolyticus]TSJ82136.1 PorT family protein [Algibacter amylolyticus]
MKKTIILGVIAAVTFFKTTQAQTISFGAKAGLNVSTFNGNRSGDEINRNSLIGFHAGLIAETRINDFINLQPEIIYSRGGAEEENIVKFQLDYISIPVMFKFYVADRLSIDVGPQFGFLVGDKAKFEDDNVPEFDTDASTFDFALNTGLGIDISDKWFSQIRYSYGVTTIAENPDVKNGIFQFSIGRKF